MMKLKNILFSPQNKSDLGEKWSMAIYKLNASTRFQA